MKIYEGQLSAKGKRFAIVVARFNSLITKQLLEGALDCLKRHGAVEKDIEVAWVPGSFEIPAMAQAMAKSKKFSSVICLGALVRGATVLAAHTPAVAVARSTNRRAPRWMKVVQPRVPQWHAGLQRSDAAGGG